MTLRIGTRGSRLALAQAQWVAARVRAIHPGAAPELVVIRTSGDRIADRPLSAIGGKGLFVKEIDEALLAGQIDCAVHSMKDLPAELAPGTRLAAVPEREDPCDLLLTRRPMRLVDLPAGARVGTSSLRRAALVRARRADLEVGALRGNVDTRLRKLDAGEIDAIVVAAAGLRRLGIEPAHAERLDPGDFVPAIGQGALAITARADDLALLTELDHDASRLAVTAERAFLYAVGGSCVTPLAAHATLTDGTLTLRALIARPDGQRIVRGETHGASQRGADLGADLAARLLADGGAEILRELGG